MNNTVILNNGASLRDALEHITGDTTVIIAGAIKAEALTVASHKGTLTFTSVYGSADYRKSGAKIIFEGSVTMTMGGESIFENITLDIKTSAVIAANFHPLTLGEGVRIIGDMSVEQNGLYIVGGENNAQSAEQEYSGDTKLAVYSGTVSRLVGFSRGCVGRVHTGHADITVGGDALVRYAVAGAMGDGATAGSASLQLYDQAVIEAVHMGGAKNENTLSGDMEVHIHGGDIYRFDTVGLFAVGGKKRLTYDPRTAFEGLLFLAELVRFDSIQSTCDIEGHSFGEPYQSPFDESMKIHTCTVCSHTEPTNAGNTAKYEHTVFAADGGFGDGSSPSCPVGSYDLAMKAVCNGGGCIVAVGKLTVKANLKDSFDKKTDSYREPLHKSQITVTSCFDGVDYRRRGAALVFSQSIDYRMSGPLTLKNLTIEVTDKVTHNNIVARYNPLHIEEGVSTPKKDGYKLDVIGGYLGFCHTDTDLCEIEDEYLEIVCASRPLSDGFENTPLEKIKINPKLSLRPRAADAFNRMFDDMKAQGLKLPFVSDAMRPYYRQYALYTGYLCRLRRTFGYDFYRAQKVVSRSCALPCTSEHHYGVAVDMYDADLTQFSKKHHYYDITPEWAWVQEHGAEYGIVLRYPADKVDMTGFIYEPWHFRYVGADVARVLRARGITLEEYVAALTGCFDKSSDVKVESGSYNSITAFSRDTGYIQLTGKHFISIGDRVEIADPSYEVSEC